ncbi:FBP domain-containing protein [Streptacidiphilus cavernicola]|uniref:FBP domain-containing protein n=1 Tax=Streptacidiphilus cavernicola TaxID=3342716 RepID=A0ABV6W620_9ACTN
MRPLDENEIRASFVNCSKGEAGRLSVPKPLDAVRWPDLDYLGWRDPGAPDRGYLVAELDDRLVGVTLRAPSGPRKSFLRSNLCSICVTSHAGSGVALLTARKAGPAGREGNTVGAYLCADLACSLYVRGLKRSGQAQRIEETLTLDEQLARTRANLDAFLAQVLV